MRTSLRRCLLGALLGLALGAAALGQERASDSKVYVIRGATIHTLAGDPIENGTVVIRDGRISGVGRKLGIPRGAEVIAAEGLHVYPGMLDAFSNLGLTEIGAVRSTSDTGEKGEFNPQLEAAIAVHPASEHIPVARANGITEALVVPGAMSSARSGLEGDTLIPGLASLMNLNGWTWEEMLIDPAIGMVLVWPAIDVSRESHGESGAAEEAEPSFKSAREKYEQRIAEIEKWFEAARHYGQAKRAGTIETPDSKLEALLPAVEGKRRVIVVANQARAIRNAAAFAEKHKLHMILAGGFEAWKEKALLKEKNIPVILGPTQVLPGREDDPYDKPYSAPGELSKAGVKIAFGSFSSSDSRLLPYQAANAVPFGLSREEALKSVTLYPAEILGVADRLGTIAEGKLANLIVTDGDPLEITTQVKHLFIKGELISTGNKQRELYEKYRARP